MSRYIDQSIKISCPKSQDMLAKNLDILNTDARNIDQRFKISCLKFQNILTNI